MRPSLCVLLQLALVLGCGPSEDDFVSVNTGQSARDAIARVASSVTIPQSASDFYCWDEGLLSDHTTFWSFKCVSIDECKLAAALEHSSGDFSEWRQPKYDFILKGPAYFGGKYETDSWDVSRIKKGSSALYIRYNNRASELHYTAIDFSTLRVYRLRWFGDSLTTKLDKIGFANASSGDDADPSESTIDELVALFVSSIGETVATPPPTPFDPPIMAIEINDILQQCIREIFTNPQLKDSREFYGTPGTTDIVLLNGWKPDWPADFNPKVCGFELRYGKTFPASTESNRILGIRLDKLDVTAPSTGFWDGNITLTLSNVGGTKNAAVHGGCMTYFTIHRQGESYVAKYSGSLDP